MDIASIDCTMEVHVFGPWPDDDAEDGVEVSNIDGGYECCLFDTWQPRSKDVEYSNNLGKCTHLKRAKLGERRAFGWLKRHLVFKTLLHKVRKTPAHEESFATHSTIASTTHMTHYSTAESSDDGSTPLIQQRLLRSGIDLKMPNDFGFVDDCVSKEVITRQSAYEGVTEYHKNVTHVKTGIWQVTCVDEIGHQLVPFFVVTGVAMTDRVDTKKLRKAIFAGQSQKRKPKLRLAPTKVAEELAGYQSGTMAPICHSVDMKLYLDESIAAKANVPGHKFKVGSGICGKCLSISAGKLVQVAKSNSKGLEICELKRSTKKA